MSAKDKEGFQEFTREPYPVLPPELTEELSALTQNLLEGHQGVGDSPEMDPYIKAVRYLEKHGIVQLFQVTIATYVKKPLIVMRSSTNIKRGVKRIREMLL